MADASTCLPLIETIINSISSFEDNKKKTLFEIRNSLIQKIDGETNEAFKNEVFRDEFASLQVPKGELDKRSAQLGMMPARYLDAPFTPDSHLIRT